jgi:hypothetical protein
VPALQKYWQCSGFHGDFLEKTAGINDSCRLGKKVGFSNVESRGRQLAGMYGVQRWMRK